MVRPKKLRFVDTASFPDAFIPEGCSPAEILKLPVEGLEALRLSDVEGLDQENAAMRMGVSRQTYGRVLSAARRVVAEALVNKYRLEIEGGSYTHRGRQSGGKRRRRRRRDSFDGP